jgi:CheY-like chemotaxis protein
LVVKREIRLAGLLSAQKSGLFAVGPSDLCGRTFISKNCRLYGTLASPASYIYALIAVGRALIAVILAGRALIAAIPVVTAEELLRAAMLIIENDVSVSHIAEPMIADGGHNTLSASDIDEAFSVLRSSQRIDAFFTDIYLKTAVLCGCELAHQAIKLGPHLQMLYTTGNSITDKMKTLFVDVAHFFRKAYEQHHLQHSVEELLHF